MTALAEVCSVKDSRSPIRYDEWNLWDNKGIYYAVRKEALTLAEEQRGLAQTVHAPSPALRKARIRRQQELADSLKDTASDQGDQGPVHT